MGISYISNTLYSPSVGYKGTAFGDPAETATVNKPKPTTAKSYPVEFKGTAFGDPAVIATVNTPKPAIAKSYPVEFKGTAFGDPAVIAKTDTATNNYKVVAGSGAVNKITSLAEMQTIGNRMDIKA